MASFQITNARSVCGSTAALRSSAVRQYKSQVACARPCATKAMLKSTGQGSNEEQTEQGPSKVALRLVGAAMAAQLAMVPLAGQAFTLPNPFKPNKPEFSQKFDAGRLPSPEQPVKGKTNLFTDQKTGLDEVTEQKGLAATIEGSDITNQDATEVVTKLKGILPDIKNQLANAARKSGDTYPDSIVKELETVETEIEGLLRQAEQGGDQGNIKSLASSIEQQVNALKAIVGFD